jgi:hypothetical protein
MASIVSSVSEGLRNAPRLYGGGVREPDEVKDFKTGVAAGVKVSKEAHHLEGARLIAQCRVRLRRFYCFSLW